MGLCASALDTGAVAMTVSPVEPVTMHWAEGTPHLIVRLDRAALESKVAQVLGRTVRDPVCFELGMDLRTPQAQSFRGVVDLLRGELERGDGLVRQPLAVAQMEQLLMTALLAAQPSNYSDLLAGDERAAAPRAIRRAVEIIEAHAAEPLTVEDVAEAVGVSVRALQAGFHRYVKCSPMAYLREVRLDRVRDELTVADPALGVTVTDIAYRWGFVHLARFAQAYGEKFGELPSTTLRR
jgi:AraC-like DNA-binding protein